MAESHTIAENILQIQHQLDGYAITYGRPVSAIQLLAVSKGQQTAAIRAAYNSGLRAFGESYVQEALKKINELHDLTISWHFIGSIQSNKTQDIACHFDWVHSIDRLIIAQRLSAQRPPSLPPLQVCVQINLNHEPTKSGVTLSELQQLAAAITQLPRLQLRGLMALPQASTNFEQQRLHFHQIYKAFNQLQQNGLVLDTLSMGMSNDIEAAVAEGSTILRIGTAVFGKRPVTPSN
jgi:PLP dependent protein